MSRFVHWPVSNVNRRLAALLLLLLAATIGSVIYLSYALLTVNDLIKQGSQAVSDALTLQDLYINIQAAETGQRGYIITGDESYLTSYNSALAGIPKDMAMLNKQPSVKHVAGFAKLQPLINQKLAELAGSITVRREQGFEAASALVSTNQGKALMDQIRLMVYQASSAEFSSIIPKEARSQRNLDRALSVGVVLVVFVMALCILIVRFFQSAILRERAVEGAKNEFVSLASHQLRTPATNVRQYLGLVLEGYLGKLSKDQREALEVANRNNNTEISIINDLLNVAKLDLNKIHLEKVPVDMPALVRQVASDYHKVASVKRQTIRTKLVGTLPEILADETYLKSVLENLVDNACKYSPAKSTITIRLSATVAAQGKQLVIEVIDSGIGISKRDVSKLFKKFSRLPTAIDSAEGTGLGLYWVKQIVELHGGKISIVSTPGKGSTFRIVLPA
jgi:signal transduction histidine kinase